MVLVLSRVASVPGRAVAGGLLVTVALLGVSQAYASADRGPTTRYVVATRTVAPGAPLDRDALGTVAADLPAPLAARSFTDPGALVGAVALAPLGSGDLVLASQVEPAEDAAAGIELSFAIGSDRAVAGDLRPGEVVDLVATGNGPAGGAAVVAEGVTVVAVDRSSDALLDAGPALTLTLRLADRATLLQVVDAVDHGHLTVVRAGPLPA